MNFQTHKDRLPEETIKNVRNILSEVGIFPVEEAWFSFEDTSYSVSIKDLTLNAYSNGKGTSKIYALASAHAELLERIQNLCSIPGSMGIMPDPVLDFNDKVSMKFKDVLVQQSAILRGVFSFPPEDLRNIVKENDMVTCVPYYNVFEKKLELLPEFIKITSGTSGFCAGNTAEEALCQGICEIFERYMMQKVWSADFDFPTVPLSSIKEFEIYSILNKIIERGYSVIIKDCTLDGVFPVVGLIIIDNSWNRYLYAFGADPLFEVALQRCITELFQGIEHSEKARWLPLNLFSDQFKDGYFNSVEVQKLNEMCLATLNKTGELPNSFFFSSAEPQFHHAFQNEFKNHKDSLGFLLGIIERNGFKLYVRDTAILGFPAYSVYIPLMTEISKIPMSQVAPWITETPFIRKCLLNLKKSSTDDIYRCACLLEPLLDIPGDMYKACRTNFFVDYTHLMVDASADICELDHLSYLLGLMFYRTKEYKKSFKYLNLYLKEKGEALKNLKYYLCVLKYLELKISDVSESDINDTLAAVFGIDQAQEVVEDLSNPEEVFKYYSLPECGECFSCPIQEHCRYEDWSKAVLRINKKIAANPAIKQEKLNNLFS